MAWIPWDADETEQQELQVIREPIPDTMRPGIESWLIQRRHYSMGNTNATRLNMIQTALRLRFSDTTGSIDTRQLIERISARGDQGVLRVVDLLLSEYKTNGYGTEDVVVSRLRWHLDTAASAVDIGVQDGAFRLRRRLPEGVEESTQLSVDASNATAGAHLAKALREIQSLEPDTSKVMTEGIRAVEAAAGAVVTPKDRKPSMGKIVGRLRDKQDWSLTLQRRNDGHPDHHAVVLGMLETLTFAEQHRHSGEPPSQVEAQTHALLAATLVGWFSSGAIVMDAK
ncbi:hypothetical protein [Pseudoclavibacter helvolus]|uniref:hypothetical protein n=1 Tax=Pseudoclavibacter helvolus TaxID=255205 RepID=UPI00083984D6|nr:hypothetical protein [Pseudoclavibacter helvolus]